jgi:hypothetical protein
VEKRTKPGSTRATSAEDEIGLCYSREHDIVTASAATDSDSAAPDGLLLPAHTNLERQSRQYKWLSTAIFTCKDIAKEMGLMAARESSSDCKSIEAHSIQHRRWNATGRIDCAFLQAWVVEQESRATLSLARLPEA